MKQIPLTKGKFAIVDDEDYESLIGFNWKDSRGYAVFRSYEGKKPNGITKWGKTIMMHRIIINAPEGSDVDHINRNTLDNRKCNLRICTRSQNMGNQRAQEGKTSKYKGVYWDRKWWRAAIQCNGIGKKLGYYTKEIDAAKAYNEAALKLFGEFARLNDVA